MRVVLNASRIPPQRSGLFRYAQLLADALRSRGVVPYVLRSNSALRAEGEVVDLPQWLRKRNGTRLFPVLWYAYAAMLRVPRGAAVISATQHLLPFRREQIVTIHDMRTYHAPETVLQAIYARVLFPLARRNIRGVLTVSESSKRDIARVYGIDPARIHVVYLCHPGSPVPQDDERPRRPVLLMVGASFRHKNLHLAVEHHEAWSGRYRLVVVAARTPYVRGVQSRVRALGIERSVEFRTDIADAERDGLYDEAAALLYISTVEGFGIPPLEAMAHGVPCLLSDIPVLNELSGGAALMFDPERRDEWDRVVASLDDPGTRRALVEEGRRRATWFNEQRTRAMMDEALGHILA